jgi:hypothetical protein
MNHLIEDAIEIVRLFLSGSISTVNPAPHDGETEAGHNQPGDLEPQRLSVAACCCKASKRMQMKRLAAKSR